MEKIIVIIKNLYKKFEYLIQNKIPFGQKVFYIIDIILKIIFILITVRILGTSIWLLIDLIIKNFNLLIHLYNYSFNFSNYSAYLDTYVKYIDSCLIFLVYSALFSRNKLSFMPLIITILYLYLNKGYLYFNENIDILLYSFIFFILYLLLHQLIIHCYNNTIIKSHFILLGRNIKLFLHQNPLINNILEIFYKYIITIICSFSFIIPIFYFSVLVYDSFSNSITFDDKYFVELFGFSIIYSFYLLITPLIYIILFSQKKLSLHPYIITLLIVISIISDSPDYDRLINVLLLASVFISGTIIHYFHKIFIIKYGNRG